MFPQDTLILIERPWKRALPFTPGPLLAQASFRCECTTPNSKVRIWRKVKLSACHIHSVHTTVLEPVVPVPFTARRKLFGGPHSSSMILKVQWLRHLLYIRIDEGSILDPQAATQSEDSRTFSSLDCCQPIITHTHSQIRRYRRLTYTYVITVLRRRNQTGRSQWPLDCWDCGFESRRGAWMSVHCECRVLSGSLCDELITHPEESYRLCCVVVCHLDTSPMRRPQAALGRRAARGGTQIKRNFFRTNGLKIPL